MAQRKPKEPEDPALLARRDRRQAALAAWFRLKEACPIWGTPIEIVSGLLMQARIPTLAGPVLKVWRPEGRDTFRLAVDERVLEGEVEPEELLARVLDWVRR